MEEGTCCPTLFSCIVGGEGQVEEGTCCPTLFSCIVGGEGQVEVAEFYMVGREGQLSGSGNTAIPTPLPPYGRTLWYNGVPWPLCSPVWWEGRARWM